jgi:hypothetical protein
MVDRHRDRLLYLEMYMIATVSIVSEFHFRGSIVARSSAPPDTFYGAIILKVLIFTHHGACWL